MGKYYENPKNNPLMASGQGGSSKLTTDFAGKIIHIKPGGPKFE